MLRVALLLVALCAVSVNGLGFLNTQFLAFGLRSEDTALNQARLRLFRDLVYTPTNVATAFPLRNNVLVELYQANNVDPFNAHSHLRTNLWLNPVALSNGEAETGVVVAVGPDVEQRALIREGQRVIIDSVTARINLNGIAYLVVNEASILGALDIGSGSSAAARFSAYVNQANTLFTPTTTYNQFVRLDTTFV